MARSRSNGETKRKPPLEKIGPFNSGGSLLTASIWENEVESEDGDRVVYAVTFQRSYKAGNDWKDTQSFRAQDLPHLAELAREAYLSVQNLLSKK